MSNFANPENDTYQKRIILASGTAAAPSLVFANDLTKGFYFDGTNIIGVGVSGGGVTFPLLADDGSESNPSYSFTNLPGSGMTANPGLNNALQIIQNQTAQITITDTEFNLTPNAAEISMQANLRLDGYDLHLNNNSTLYLNTNNDASVHFNSGANKLAIQVPAAKTIAFQTDVTQMGSFDDNASAGNTRLILYDADSGTLQRVKVGANGTGPGGVGRALYVANF